MVVVTALALLVAGCTSGKEAREDRSPSTTGGDRSSAAAGAGSGATVRLGVPTEPASLDPFDPRSRTPAGEALLGEILPQLFRIDPSGRVEGYLANDATVREIPGPVGASFSLRRGARWSDGTPITVEDLRFTLQTVLADAWPGARAGYDRLTAVEGEGQSVVLRFDAPFPGWRRLFSGEDFVLPAHRLAGKDVTAEWKGGPDVAGGPFRLGRVTPGLEVVLERNDAWWGGKAKPAAIRVLVVPDVRTMEQLLARGELDVAWPPAAPNRTGRFRGVPGAEVSVAEPGGAVVSLVANTESVPAQRRAALLGLPDRDRFVDVLLQGEATKATSLSGPDRGSEAVWPTVKQNLGAGGGLGEDVVATVVAREEDPMGPLLGRVLESFARVPGATLELKFADTTKVEGSWLPEGRFDLALVHQVAWPQPCWRCWFGDASVGRGNVARVKGFDDLAAAAERGDAAGTLEARLQADAVLLPLWRPKAVLAARGVKGVTANSWSIGPFWKAEGWTLPE